jgi:hypothetical protein
MFSKRSESARTRSTTRPSRDEVDKIMLPHAEISTAGVIMAVKTAIAASVSIEGFIIRAILESCQTRHAPLDFQKQ